MPGLIEKIRAEKMHRRAASELYFRPLPLIGPVATLIGMRTTAMALIPGRPPLFVVWYGIETSLLITIAGVITWAAAALMVCSYIGRGRT